MVKLGANPDFSDWDEIDLDALEIVEEFYDGTASFDELKAIVGAEAAQSILDRMSVDGIDPEKLFDNPEDF